MYLMVFKHCLAQVVVFRVCKWEGPESEGQGVGSGGDTHLLWPWLFDHWPEVPSSTGHGGAGGKSTS